MDQAEQTICNFLQLLISALRSGEVTIKEGYRDGPEGPYCDAYVVPWRGHELKLLIHEKNRMMLDGVPLDFLEDNPSYRQAVLQCYELQQAARRKNFELEREREQELAKLKRRQEGQVAIARLAEKIALESAPEGM